MVDGRAYFVSGRLSNVATDRAALQVDSIKNISSITRSWT